MSSKIRATIIAPLWRGSRQSLARFARALPGSSRSWGPPRRVAPSTLEWVATHGSSAGLPTGREIHRPVDIHRNPSRVMQPAIDWDHLEGNRDDRWGPSALRVTTWPTFVAEIPNGRVVAHNGTVLTHDDTLLTDASCEFGPGKHTVLQRLWLGRPSSQRTQIAVIAANYGHVYYHWIFDVLPRIELLRLGGYHLDEFDDVIVNPIVSSLQTETLATLGIRSWISPDHKEGRFHIEAERLVVPSVVGESGVAAPWVVDFLRRTFLPAPLAVGPFANGRRIYVSRDDAAVRPVRNELDLVAALERVGFESVTLSGRTLANQAALFGSADVIVAPHGSGLTNLAFASRGTRVVEIYPRSYANPVSWHISNLVGAVHYSIFADAVPRAGLGASCDDIEVDILTTMKVVEVALAGEHFS